MRVERPLRESQPTFQQLYFFMAAMQEGFKYGCRPLISIDGCFLKGPYKGQLLCAIGRDGNKNIYPNAFAAMEAKTKES